MAKNRAPMQEGVIKTSGTKEPDNVKGLRRLLTSKVKDKFGRGWARVKATHKKQK